MVGIVWWEIETPDLESFMAFHASLWDWSFQVAFADTNLGADYWVVSSDGQVLGGLQRQGPLAAPPAAGPRLYLEVADLEDALDQVAARGGRVERGRTGLGQADRWFATFVDPSGVSFGLWTPNPRAGGA